MRRLVPALCLVSVGLLGCGGPSFEGEVEQFVLESAAVGDAFEIEVFTPAGASPTRIFYVLDGNLHGEPLAAMAQAQGVEAVVVSIGYPGGFDTVKRRRDYSPTEDPQWEASGRSTEFFEFVRDELIPEVETGSLASPSERALFGHSQGGLAVWTAAFDPDHSTFSKYVAASPALWWDGGALLDLERDHAAVASELPAQIFCTYGELEPITFPAYVDALDERLTDRAYEGLEVTFMPLERTIHNESWRLSYELALEELW